MVTNSNMTATIPETAETLTSTLVEPSTGNDPYNTSLVSEAVSADKSTDKLYESDIDEDQANANEKRKLRRKQSLESQVTSGCGWGKKKARIVDAFYETLWPILENKGWKLVKGEGKEDGAIFFLPPGVATEEVNNDNININVAENNGIDDSSMEEKSELKSSHEGEWECLTCGNLNNERVRCKQCMGWKGGARIKKSHLSRVRDVIEHVLKSSDETEVEAAEAFVKVIPDIHDQFFPPKNRSVTLARNASSREYEHIEMDWKHERTHYPKATSRVGDEYQVAELPISDVSYVPHEQSDLYEQVWDWKKAAASGKLDFCTRVQPNKKAEAYEKFMRRNFVLPGFYREVCDIPTTNGSDWTDDEKNRFRASIFKEHKNIINVSRAIGKPMKECMTYYYGTFKRSKDYPRLKLAIYRHKEKAVTTRSSAWVCDICGTGGKLIACDSCDAHYHLTCLEPPLKEVPEGSWICNLCITKPMKESDVIDNDTSLSKNDSCDKIQSVETKLSSLIPTAGSIPIANLKSPSETIEGMDWTTKKGATPVNLQQTINSNGDEFDLEAPSIFNSSTTDQTMYGRAVDSDMYEYV